MSKEARISPQIKAMIWKEALADRNKDRRLLALEIRQKLEKINISHIPAEDTIQKIISKARNSNDSEDEPWGMLTLANNDIAAEALPTVFELWAYALIEYKKPLTIREIKWAARLYQIIRDDLEGLLLASIEYAAYEKISKLGIMIGLISKEVGFIKDTELYINTHMPKLTSEELLMVQEDPEILKRKRQNLLNELRIPGILRLLRQKSKADKKMVNYK